MGDPAVLVRLALAQQACFTVWRMFVMDQRLSEKEAAWIAALEAQPGRLASFWGKYVQYETGFIHFKLNGNGQWFDELPSGVTPDQVVLNDLDVADQAPLADRLAAVVRTLRAYAEQDPELVALADATEQSLEAWRRPENGEQCFAQLREWIQAELFADNATNDPSDEIRRAHRILDRLDQFAEELHQTTTADGWTVGGLLAMRAMILAAANQSDDVRYQSYVFTTCLHYIMVLGPGRAEDAAQRLSDRMIRQGYQDAVRSAAEDLLSKGNALIDKALDGAPLTYYAALYPAAAYELAGAAIAKAAAVASFAGPDLAMMSLRSQPLSGLQPSAVGHRDVHNRQRWAGLAANAEERAVRIAAVLKTALRNLDDGGAFIEYHLEKIKRVRAEQGEGAARLAANDLIYNHLLYPKTYLATLLGQSE